MRRNETSPGLISLWSLTFPQMEEILHSWSQAKLPVFWNSLTCGSRTVLQPSDWEIVIFLRFPLTRQKFFA